MGDKSLNLSVQWVGMNKHWVLTIRRGDEVLQRAALRCGQTEAKQAGQRLLELWKIKEGGNDGNQ